MRGPGSIEPAEVVDEDDDVEDPAVELEIEQGQFGAVYIQYALRKGGYQKRAKKCVNSVVSERKRGR